MRIDMAELNDISNDFLSSFGLNMEIPIKINPRLKNTLGCFVYSPKKKQAKRIEMSKILLEIGHRDVIVDTLLHECLHYALFTLNLPYRDEDDHFVSEAKRLSVGLTEEVYVGREYIVECEECGEQAVTTIKKHLDKKLIGVKYNTGCCKSKYKHIQTVVCNGIEEKVIIV